MATIGSTVDPRMFVQDYSGFANAAAIRAAGMMNFGNQVGSAVADYAKESKQLKGEIAKGKSALAFAKAYHPELADQIDQLGAVFNDPTKSVVEQAAAGSQMGDFVAAILGGEQFKREMGLKERELGMRQAALVQELNAPQPTTLSKPFPVDMEDGSQKWMQYDQLTGATIPAIFDDPTLMPLPPMDANGNLIEDAANMWGADGSVLPPRGAVGETRPGIKPPEGGKGEVMSREQVAQLVSEGYDFKSEPVGNGEFRVTEVKGSPVSKPVKGTEMSEEEVTDLRNKGFDIKGEPLGGGKFRVTSFDTSKASTESKVELVQKAHALAKAGKKDEAIMIFQALAFSTFGMPVNMDTIESLVPEADAAPAPGGESDIDRRIRELESQQGR